MLLWHHQLKYILQSMGHGSFLFKGPIWSDEMFDHCRLTTLMQQSIVRRTIGPPGMVRHLFNVRRVSMYHDGPQCPNYDGHSSTTTELSVSFVTYHYSILTNHYCHSDGRFIGKYAYACTHCTCILLQKQVQPCWILKLHFLIRGRGWLAPVADLHSRSAHGRTSGYFHSANVTSA